MRQAKQKQISCDCKQPGKRARAGGNLETPRFVSRKGQAKHRLMRNRRRPTASNRCRIRSSESGIRGYALTPTLSRAFQRNRFHHAREREKHRPFSFRSGSMFAPRWACAATNDYIRPTNGEHRRKFENRPNDQSAAKGPPSPLHIRGEGLILNRDQWISLLLPPDAGFHWNQHQISL
jgi:hypothetical protein